MKKSNKKIDKKEKHIRTKVKKDKVNKKDKVKKEGAKKGNKGPLVSVLICTYNSEHTVADTLRCIINQSYENIEIIVSDNCSTDNTEKVVKSFKDKRIRFKRNDKNYYFAGNVNITVPMCKGEYIAIYHSDDTYHKDIVKKQLELISSDEKMGAVFTIGKIINENGGLIRRIKLPFPWKSRIFVGDKKDIYPLMMQYGNFFMCPTAFLRKEIFKKVGKYATEFRGPEDQDMWMRILKKGYKLGIVNEELTGNRVHPNKGSFTLNDLRVDLSLEYKLYDDYIKKGIIRVDEKVMEKYKEMKSKGYLYAAVQALIAKKKKKFIYNLNESRKTFKHNFPSAFFGVYLYLKIMPRALSRSSVILAARVMKLLNLHKKYDYLLYV